MDPAGLEQFCLGLPGAWSDYPWEHDFPAMKVGPQGKAKIFAFLGADSVGVKAGPNREFADEWLLRYPDDASVMAYIGRSGWNTLRTVGAIPEQEIHEAIVDSYRLVVAGIPKKYRPVGWDSV